MAHLIPDLFDYLPNLNVAVLLGSSYAWQLEGEIESHRPGVKILKGPHPSPRELIDRSPPPITTPRERSEDAF